MPTIYQPPVGIICQILSEAADVCVESVSSWAKCLSLLGVCRVWRGIGQRILYSHAVIEFPARLLLSPCRAKGTLPSNVRTNFELMRKNNMAGRVKDLVVRLMDVDDSTLGHTKTSFNSWQMISIIISKLMNQPNFTAFLPATSKEDERIQEHVCSYIEVIKTAFPKTHIILVEDSAMHESLNSGTFCIVNYSAVWYGTAKHIAEPSAFIVPCPRNPIFDAKRRLNLSTMMLYAHFKHIMELGQRDGLNFKYGGFLPVGVMHRAGVFYPTVQLNTSTEHKVKFELLSLI